MQLPKNQRFFLSDVFYKTAGLGSTLLFVGLVLSLVGSLLWNSRLSLERFGFSFITGERWHAPFFEPSSVGIRADDNAFVIRFTAPPLNLEAVTIAKAGQTLLYSIEAAGKGAFFTLEEGLEGAYTITIPASISTEDRDTLGKDIIWQGSVEFSELASQSFTQSGKEWQPTSDENTRMYGILPFILGSVISSLLALCIACPAALAAALYLTDFSKKNSPSAMLFAVLIDLLAGIPSIIYGMWGLFFVVPRLGANLLSASIILSIMTVPYAASLMAESIRLVPEKIRQAGLALGASQTRLIFNVVLPYARSGIIAGVLLSLGRALGETLAVTMVIGNRNAIPTSLIEPAQTIASLIANEYGEASGLKQSALIEGGFVLILITIFFSLIGRWIIRRMNKGGAQ